MAIFLDISAHAKVAIMDIFAIVAIMAGRIMAIYFRAVFGLISKDGKMKFRSENGI